MTSTRKARKLVRDAIKHIDAAREAMGRNWLHTEHYELRAATALLKQALEVK
jgi:hypothetical protein